MSQAGIINVSGGGGGSLNTISGDDSTIVTPLAGNIVISGNVVNNGTHAKAVFTQSPVAHQEDIDVQVSTSISSSDITKVGLASFDINNFTVDSNGFVQLNFHPNQVIQDFDDFLNSDGSGAAISKLRWQGSANFDQFPGTATNPGIVSTASGSDAVSLAMLENSGNPLNGAFKLGGGALNINFVMNLVALSTVANRYVSFIGMSDTQNSFPVIAPTNGVYFQYRDNVNAGNWQLVCNKGGVTTIVNTSTPVTTGFHNFGIQINATATSVSFTLDGTSIGSAIITNIPTANIYPAISFVPSAGNAPAFQIDLFYYTQTLTVAR